MGSSEWVNVWVCLSVSIHSIHLQLLTVSSPHHHRFLLSFLHCASFIVPPPLSPKNVHFAINVRYSRLPAQLVCLNTQPTVQLDSTRLSRHANFEIGADLPKLPLEAIPFCQILSLSLSSMTLLVRDTKTEEMEESMRENTKATLQEPSPARILGLNLFCGISRRAMINRTCDIWTHCELSYMEHPLAQHSLA